MSFESGRNWQYLQCSEGDKNVVYAAEFAYARHCRMHWTGETNFDYYGTLKRVWWHGYLFRIRSIMST
jgi:hypothetical protein